MRLYAFSNYYLSSLQQGLQTAHLVANLFCQNSGGTSHRLDEWARWHKTIVILNGGNSANISAISHQLSTLGAQLGLPNASFCEDIESLNGAITVTGIVVPSNVYEFAAVREWNVTNIHLESVVSPTERELATILQSYPLAR